MISVESYSDFRELVYREIYRVLQEFISPEEQWDVLQELASNLSPGISGKKMELHKSSPSYWELSYIPFQFHFWSAFRRSSSLWVRPLIFDTPYEYALYLQPPGPRRKPDQFREWRGVIHFTPLIPPESFVQRYSEWLSQFSDPEESEGKYYLGSWKEFPELPESYLQPLIKEMGDTGLQHWFAEYGRQEENLLRRASVEEEIFLLSQKYNQSLAEFFDHLEGEYQGLFLWGFHIESPYYSETPYLEVRYQFLRDDFPVGAFLSFAGDDVEPKVKLFVYPVEISVKLEGDWK